MKAPERVVANFYWEYEYPQDRRVRSDTPNYGTLDEQYTEDCGCEIATYSLDECGGPADLLLDRCADYRGPFCLGYYHERVDAGRGGFTIEVVS